MKYDAIVVAAGKGNRANLGYNKTFFKMPNNKTVLENSCHLFLEDQDCENLIVVTNKDLFDAVIKNDKIIVVEGGKERKDSVYNGLQKVKNEYVLVHDAARPFLHKDALSAIKQKVEETGAAVLAHVAIDGVKVVENGKIVDDIEKSKIYLSETPQGFKSELLKKCYDNIDYKNYPDEAALVCSQGYDVYVVNDEHENRKLTYKEDFIHD